jgi:hypothetical protein
MPAPHLGSILLGTSNPERLQAWYNAALAPEQDEFGWMNFGGIRVLIDGRSDIAEKNPEPGRTILNFHVGDARATAAHLNELGVSWLVEVEERENGLFGTLIDPDGNYVQIIELSQEYLATQQK